MYEGKLKEKESLVRCFQQSFRGAIRHRQHFCPSQGSLLPQDSVKAEQSDWKGSSSDRSETREQQIREEEN